MMYNDRSAIVRRLTLLLLLHLGKKKKHKERSANHVKCVVLTFNKEVLPRVSVVIITTSHCLYKTNVTFYYLNLKIKVCPFLRTSGHPA